MHFGPYYLGSKCLQQACDKLKLNKVVGEASGKLRFVQDLEIWQSILLFFDGNAKKQRSIGIKCAQTHFESVWVITLVIKKKNLSKILLNWGNLVM